IVRISQIETRLLSIDGVLDITNTMINEVKSNLTIDSNSIVVRAYMAVIVCARGKKETTEAFKLLIEELEDNMKTGKSSFRGEEK
ncbi:hypothetical protein ACTPEM_25475, partial [Clostridioides difficile]